VVENATFQHDSELQCGRGGWGEKSGRGVGVRGEGGRSGPCWNHKALATRPDDKMWFSSFKKSGHLSVFPRYFILLSKSWDCRQYGTSVFMKYPS